MDNDMANRLEFLVDCQEKKMFISLYLKPLHQRMTKALIME